MISFRWEVFFNYSNYVYLITFLLVCLSIIAYILDKKYHWKLKYYGLTTLILFISIAFISYPIKKWQIESSITKSERLIYAIEDYKEVYKVFPKSIEEVEAKLQIELPKRTNIGTKYWYEKYGSEEYLLHFLSYSGYSAHYNAENKEWLFTD